MTIDDFRGKPCKNCGEIIEVYSRSGLCRKCWHSNRANDDRIISFCEKCGRPQNIIGICASCEKEGDNRLKRYRTYHCQAEHRFVYEYFEGRMPDGYVIHHLNGLKGDNRKVNLMAVPRIDHDTKSFIRGLQGRIRQLEGL